MLVYKLLFEFPKIITRNSDLLVFNDLKLDSQ